MSLFLLDSSPYSATPILASHRPSVVERMRGHEVVLTIQDTSDLDFSSLKQTSGLGFINQSQQQVINQSA